MSPTAPVDSRHQRWLVRSRVGVMAVHEAEAEARLCWGAECEVDLVRLHEVLLVQEGPLMQNTQVEGAATTPTTHTAHSTGCNEMGCSWG